MEWYEELDFDENPLIVETRYVGNREVLEESYYTIVSGNILVIEGTDGTGKTKILKEMIKRFGGHGRVAYVSCKDMEKELNVEDVLAKRNGFLGWLLKKYPRNMVLLLDDVEHLSAKNMERIKYFFDTNHLRAIVITTKDYQTLNLGESVKQRVRKTVQLRPLSEYEAVQVVQDRLGEDVLNDRVIKETYRQSDRNLEKFLSNCELLCKAYVANKNLTEGDVKDVLARGVK